MRKFFKAEWFWGKETDIWLKKMLIGKTLNFPCGMSQIGDIRADKDKICNPNVIADIRAPEIHFKKGEFETVLCDPPFSFWAYDKVYSWFFGICALASKRLIFRYPLVRLDIQHKGWKKEYFIVVKTDALSLNMFYVFTNLNATLKVLEV